MVPAALLDEVLRPFVPHLTEVAREIRHWVGDPGPLLAPAVERLVPAGSSGKQLRPVLALVCAGRRLPPAAVRSGAMVELLHVATLFHDDVIDGALERRGRPTANAELGVPAAIMAGDYLLARASALAADLGRDVAWQAAEAVTSVCKGQAEEMLAVAVGGRTEEQYLASVAGKTGALTALACWLGTRCAGLDEQGLARAHAAGLHFGVAYQVVDDLLDLCGPEVELGHPCGTDLSLGVETLAIIRGREMIDAASGRAPVSWADRAAALAGRLDAGGVLDATRATAVEELQRSRELARGLPGERGLDSLSRWLVARADAALASVRTAA